MGETIGFNEANVNALVANANSKIKEAVASFGEKAQNIMTKLQENWGTAEGKDYGDFFVTQMKSQFDSIANKLAEIPKVIRTTAEAQAADTNNAVSISREEVPDTPTISNTMLDKLDNGFVGIYNTLKTDVSAATEEMKTDVTSKLSNLRSVLSEEAKNCFQAESEYYVAEKLGEFTDQARESLEQTLQSLIEQMDEQTAKIDTIERNIQAAGIR